MPSITLSRIKNSLSYRLRKFLRIDSASGARVQHCKNLEKLGTVYGGWIIPTDLLDGNSICYCVGTGEDISFDIELMKRFECKIFAFDPTPRAIQFTQKATETLTSYHFFPVGLWDSDTIVKFYSPSNSEHVSHSIVNLQHTENGFEAECKRLSSLMRENHHSRLDLLKLDIEGAEYQVIDSILQDGIEIKILCIEFHQIDADASSHLLRTAVQKLVRSGFNLVAVDNQNYTFIH
jgi:FkbM family methyltransferase